MHFSPQKFSFPRCASGVFVFATVLLTGAARSETIEFNRDIRPILSDNCFSCHGFDAKHREADLRLDTPEGALAPAESGALPIVPGDLARSEVWLRIISEDKDDIIAAVKKTVNF